MAMAKFNKSNIKELLQSSILQISFEKADGTIREMEATLAQEYVPQSEVKEEVSGQTLNKKKSDDALAVWDLEKAAWRSFRWDKLKTINEVEVELLES